MGQIIKQAMLIGSSENSLETTEAFAIDCTFEMEALAPSLNFKLPYLLPGQKNVINSGVDITRLKKYDTVKLYFKEFDTDPGDITVDDLELVFDGYINTISLSKTKSDISYSINALGTAGLCNTRTPFYQQKGDELHNVIRRALEDSELNKIIIPNFIDASISSLWINITGGKSLKEMFDQVKDKYAVIITQDGRGRLNIFTPSFLASANAAESELNTYKWIFDINDGTIFEIDYGDITSNINAVVVTGFPPSYGIAVDLIAVQNVGGQKRYVGFEKMDLVGVEACEKYAQDKLLEIERNYVVSFKTKFNPAFMVGQRFSIIDNDYFTGEELFFLKKYTFRIDKQDVSCDISGFTHSLTVIPERLVISNTGIADLDITGNKEKIENSFFGDFS